jgi:hypothetical protein
MNPAGVVRAQAARWDDTIHVRMTADRCGKRVASPSISGVNNEAGRR